jgi:hypothetical protein
MEFGSFLRSLFSQETPGMSLLSDETEPFERCIKNDLDTKDAGKSQSGMVGLPRATY